MTSVVRNDPPRWAKLVVWASAIGVCWLVVAAAVMGFALWPWPTAVLTAAVAGVVVGALWATVRLLRSGERPAVRMFDQDGRDAEASVYRARLS